MVAVFFFIAHEKGFKFHAQPKTGAYSCLFKDPPLGRIRHEKNTIGTYPGIWQSCPQHDLSTAG